MEYNYDVVLPWGVLVTEVSFEVMEKKRRKTGGGRERE